MKPKHRKMVRIEALKFVIPEGDDVEDECVFCQNPVMNGDVAWILGLSRSKKRQPITVCSDCMGWLERRCKT